MKHLSLAILICFIGCKQLSNYEKQIKAYENYSAIERSESLWDITDSPWAWNYSFQRIEEILKFDINIEYVDSSQFSYTTPFLNASGALECLRGKDQRRVGEIDSMEIEAIKIVKYLAKKGANTHATSTSRKLNALHLAACGGREKMIPVLVGLGLDINSRDSSDIGATVLLHAIGAGDLPTVKSVINTGANINLNDLSGNSPLDWAMYMLRVKKNNLPKPYNDQEAIVKYMESVGAKNSKNNFNGLLLF